MLKIESQTEPKIVRLNKIWSGLFLALVFILTLTSEAHARHSRLKGVVMRLLISGIVAIIIYIVAHGTVSAAVPTSIQCAPVATFSSNTALPGRVVCPIYVFTSDGSLYTGPVELSGANSSDFSLLSNRGLLLASSLAAGNYDVTLTAGAVSMTVQVSVTPLGPLPTAVSCAPVASLTTTTSVPGTVVCPIAVTTSDGSPFAGTLSVVASGNPPNFALSNTGLPANLLISTLISLPGTYTLQIIAQTPFGSLTVPVSISVSSPVVGKATTHLYNNQRTGWNSNETILNASNVASSFGLLGSVAVDEQVDAQPLVITRANGADEVFVATENDTIYRIDAVTGEILQSRNLGTPVPMSSLPGACNNNSSVVGITSTPVIDVGSETLYVMTYTMENGSQTYRLHALDLESLADKFGGGIVVTATRLLPDSTTYTFNAAVSRQRSALLEANGNIYAAFASFCDLAASVSRGWILGWDARTLAPLAANELTNQQPVSKNNFFLSSIWMSGAGPAADENGNLFFATGNSDPSGTSYDPSFNLCESVVEMSPDLSAVIGAFTPMQSPDSQPGLDAYDSDLGAGGVLLIPHQPSLPIPDLALSVGKSGYYYLLDRGTAFAGVTSTVKVSQRLASGLDCHCANSYFVGADAVPRIVTGLSNVLSVYRLQSSGSSAVMNLENQQSLSSGQDGGFLTSVSSNGTVAGSAVIWAVTRPYAPPFDVHLVAYDDAQARLIYNSSGTEAGIWPHTNGNANLVPVVADGRVFVASYKNLSIFGIGGSP